jgi:hypothetical protein
VAGIEKIINFVKSERQSIVQTVIGLAELGLAHEIAQYSPSESILSFGKEILIYSSILCGFANTFCGLVRTAVPHGPEEQDYITMWCVEQKIPGIINHLYNGIRREFS